MCHYFIKRETGIKTITEYFPTCFFFFIAPFSFTYFPFYDFLLFLLDASTATVTLENKFTLVIISLGRGIIVYCWTKPSRKKIYLFLEQNLSLHKVIPSKNLKFFKFILFFYFWMTFDHLINFFYIHRIHSTISMCLCVLFDILLPFFSFFFAWFTYINHACGKYLTKVYSDHI